MKFLPLLVILLATATTTATTSVAGALKLAIAIVNSVTSSSSIIFLVSRLLQFGETRANFLLAVVLVDCIPAPISTHLIHHSLDALV